MSAADTAVGTQDIDNLTQSFNRMSSNEARLGSDGEPIPRTEEEYAQSQLTLRAIVSSKEAGVIIGKAGKNVADLRDETGVRAGVSKVVPGVHDRVLTVNGALSGISKAYHIVSKGLLEGAPAMGMGGLINTNGTHRKSLSLHARTCMLRTFHIKMLTGFLCSRPPSDISQSNGNDHWPSRSQNQADSGRIWRAHGRAERDAAAIHRAHC